MIIGLTGGFGTGKSFIASLFKSYGARVIDADRIAHQVTRRGTPSYHRIVRVFGRGILKANGALDRTKLAAIVFTDRPKRLVLEQIVHPVVIRTIMARISRARFGSAVVIDAPLLVESGLAKIVDCLVVATASRKRQVERCVKKFGITSAEAKKRISSQIPLRRKVQIADYVIHNDGARPETRKQARKVWCAVWT